MQILVVDDEEHLRRMMRLTLETVGYEVGEAAEGEEALKLFGDGHRYEATLLDQRMPGMDGLEVLRRMKLVRADACIIMVTAYATIELAVDAMKLGATDFVRKPMTPDTLRNAVAAALVKRGQTPPATAVPDPQLLESPPTLEIWTTNGFFVRRLEAEGASSDAQTTEHHFLARRGKGHEGTEVVVVIDRRAVAGVARETGKDLRPAGAFWREQAQSALLNHLWNEAELPPAGRLVITRVTGAMVNAAMAWSGDRGDSGPTVPNSD
jgi:DNA-binding response OmpR family regulator